MKLHGFMCGFLSWCKTWPTKKMAPRISQWPSAEAFPTGGVPRTALHPALCGTQVLFGAWVPCSTTRDAGKYPPPTGGRWVETCGLKRKKEVEGNFGKPDTKGCFLVFFFFFV